MRREFTGIKLKPAQSLLASVQASSRLVSTGSISLGSGSEPVRHERPRAHRTWHVPARCPGPGPAPPPSPAWCWQSPPLPRPRLGGRRCKDIRSSCGGGPGSGTDPVRPPHRRRWRDEWSLWWMLRWRRPCGAGRLRVLHLHQQPYRLRLLVASPVSGPRPGRVVSPDGPPHCPARLPRPAALHGQFGRGGSAERAEYGTARSLPHRR